MVPIKPHTITVSKVTQDVGGNSVRRLPRVRHDVPASVIKCYAEPMRPGEDFKKFGVELNAPYKFHVEVVDAALMLPDNQIVYSGETYVQVGPCEVFTAGLPTDHAVAYAQLLNHPRQ
jgi:hypothetical protein